MRRFIILTLLIACGGQHSDDVAPGDDQPPIIDAHVDPHQVDPVGTWHMTYVLNPGCSTTGGTSQRLAYVAGTPGTYVVAGESPATTGSITSCDDATCGLMLTSDYPPSLREDSILTLSADGSITGPVDVTMRNGTGGECHVSGSATGTRTNP